MRILIEEKYSKTFMHISKKRLIFKTADCKVNNTSFCLNVDMKILKAQRDFSVWPFKLRF